MRVLHNLGLLPIVLVVTGCSDSGQQLQNHFEAALANSSTAPSLVRIELTQGGERHIACVFAEDLIRAVMAERRLQGQQGYEEAVRSARSNERHRFAFQDPDAIEALNLNYDEQERQQGCVIIARGRPALRDDITGEIRAGSPFGDL